MTTEPYTAHGPFIVQSPEWHEHRAKCIGASEIASILQVPGAYSTPVKVWAEKRQIIEKDPDAVTPEWMTFGLKMEPIIAEEFAERTSLIVEPEDRQFISTLYPFLGCSLDRWVWKDKAKGPLELKNTSSFMKDRWEDGIYLPYQVQIQGQMAVTGAEFAAVAVLIGGNEFKWAIAERNQRFIDAMLEKLEKFWEMVVNDEMPEPTAADNKLMGTLLGPEEHGEVVAFDHDFIEVDEELERVKEEIKELEKKKNALEAKIKKALGKAERGLLPTGGSYSFKTVKRDGYTVQPSETRQLRKLK